MKIYKVKYECSDEDTETQVLTARSKEQVSNYYSDKTIVEKESYGPYINESVYREVRKEILD